MPNPSYIHARLKCITEFAYYRIPIDMFTVSAIAFSATKLDLFVGSFNNTHLDVDYSLCRSQCSLVFLQQGVYLDLACSRTGIDQNAD